MGCQHLQVMMKDKGMMPFKDHKKPRETSQQARVKNLIVT
jgi:hypothetical protein